MAKKPKSTWSLDSIKIYLTNDKGDEIILNSGDLTDYTKRYRKQRADLLGLYN
jgi:hypothetical protein